MHYEPITPMTREEAQEALDSQNKELIIRALLSLANFENDRAWVEKLCLYYAMQFDGDVRYVALISLGHLARIHRVLDLQKTSDVLAKLSNDRNALGYIDDVIDDIRVFIDSQFNIDHTK